MRPTLRTRALAVPFLLFAFLLAPARARAADGPASSETASFMFETSTTASGSANEPKPSWPEAEVPQQWTWPLLSSAQLCLVPAAGVTTATVA